MNGGAGADLFVFETATGADVQAAASQVAADVVIDLGGGDSVTLLGVNLGDLQASDFILG